MNDQNLKEATTKEKQSYPAASGGAMADAPGSSRSSLWARRSGRTTRKPQLYDPASKSSSEQCKRSLPLEDVWIKTSYSLRSMEDRSLLRKPGESKSSDVIGSLAQASWPGLVVEGSMWTMTGPRPGGKPDAQIGVVSAVLVPMVCERRWDWRTRCWQWSEELCRFVDRCYKKEAGRWVCRDASFDVLRPPKSLGSKADASSTLLFIDSVSISKRFRGVKLGLECVRGLLDGLRPHYGLAALMPCPLDSALPVRCAQSTVLLGAAKLWGHWARLGFRGLKNCEDGEFMCVLPGDVVTSLDVPSPSCAELGRYVAPSDKVDQVEEEEGELGMLAIQALLPAKRAFSSSAAAAGGSPLRKKMRPNKAKTAPTYVRDDLGYIGRVVEVHSGRKIVSWGKDWDLEVFCDDDLRLGRVRALFPMTHVPWAPAGRSMYNDKAMNRFNKDLWVKTNPPLSKQGVRGQESVRVVAAEITATNRCGGNVAH